MPENPRGFKSVYVVMDKATAQTHTHARNTPLVGGSATVAA
jgi:hypothetical protein